MSVTNGSALNDTTTDDPGATATAAAHAASHQHGGSDAVATATAAANVIPKAGGAGTLAIGFIPLGSSASTVCVGNDARLSDARTPTAHAASHQNGGSDEVATATAGANAIPKAGGAGTLAIGWIPLGTSASTVTVGNDARLVQPSGMQVGTATLTAGTVTISSVTITASSRILVTYKTPGGTTGTNLAVPSGSRTVGAGSGSFVVNAVDTAGATVNTDTSTFDWMIMN